MKNPRYVTLSELLKSELVSAEEKGKALVTAREFDPEHFVIMCTKNGTIKKTGLDEFSNPRSPGIIALNIAEGDELISAALTDDKSEILIDTSEGKAVVVGRVTQGVRLTKLDSSAKVADVAKVIKKDEETEAELGISDDGNGEQ